MKIQNKEIVVTGGGSGMARALALHLNSKGARVLQDRFLIFVKINA